MRFKSRGQDYDVDRKDVLAAARKTKPGLIRTHAVEVNGTDFPVTQLFAVVTGQDPADVSLGQARRVFQGLEFLVKRVS